jgi:hypothetical protein
MGNVIYRGVLSGLFYTGYSASLLLGVGVGVGGNTLFKAFGPMNDLKIVLSEIGSRVFTA